MLNFLAYSICENAESPICTYRARTTMNVARKMAVFTVVRACWLALYASYAVESFVVPVRGPRFSSSTPSLARHPTSAQTQNAGTPPYLPSTLRMSSYDDGSGASAGGDMTGSTEMELQELVVDFTDDGRILLEVKGVKVGSSGGRNVPHQQRTSLNV